MSAVADEAAPLDDLAAGFIASGARVDVYRRRVGGSVGTVVLWQDGRQAFRWWVDAAGKVMFDVTFRKGGSEWHQLAGRPISVDRVTRPGCHA